ncbi:hypothetical protein ACVWZ6_000487 [Bradyrhizobium sp. GM6.1]
MLDAIGSRERIQPWVDAALARGERMMGFGHRVYRVRDPRADVLKTAIEALASDGADLPFAGEVEAYIRAALRKKNPDRPLETNVEFFTAILLDALAIPRQAFTPIFAVARAAGWTAHAREQQRTGRLIRPSSSYVGAMPKARRECVARSACFPSPLAGEGGSPQSGETGEGLSRHPHILQLNSPRETPHPALRATFSRKGRREESAREAYASRTTVFR